jgi:hypothetical protein
MAPPDDVATRLGFNETECITKAGQGVPGRLWPSVGLEVV